MSCVDEKASVCFERHQDACLDSSARRLQEAFLLLACSNVPQNLKRAAIHQTRDGKWGYWGPHSAVTRAIIKKNCRAARTTRFLYWHLQHLPRAQPIHLDQERAASFLARPALAACVRVCEAFLSLNWASFVLYLLLFSTTCLGA